jgi:FKBP-type peptidyl-prolyl cis-trans isomerase
MKPYIIFAVIGLILIVLAWKGEGLILSKFNTGNLPEEEGVLSESGNVAANQQNSAALSSPDDQLKFDITKNGEGAEIKNGDKATVHYIGKLKNNTVFDSSYDRGTPFEFELGAGEVIRGWDMGVLGMKVGEKRQLIIPARYGYGENGMGSIPGGATLVFEVELLKIN